jgi:hypothetical protein
VVSHPSIFRPPRSGTLRLLLSQFHTQDLVCERDSLISRWTISFLKDDLICHRFAQRSLLLVDSQSPLPGGRIEGEGDFRRFPSDEEALRLVIPIELKWPLL